MRTIGRLLALASFLLAATASRPAWADTTLTGTVGEIGTYPGIASVGDVVRFKFTDLNQTAACIDPGGSGTLVGYAFVSTNFAFFKEVFAMLLVSKKGATLNCVIGGTPANNGCGIKNCTLP